MRGNHLRIPSAVAVKSLGYECEDLTAADAASGLDVTLAGLFRYKKYAPLKAAWEWGQFLRNLKAKASVVDTVSEAARALKLSSGQELRNILDTDPEAANIWYQKRLDTKIKTRQGLLKAVEDGNQAAIKVVENYLKDEESQRPASSDLTKLLQKEIADLFDVSRITVNEWSNKHRLTRNADGTYNLYETIKWYGEFIKRKSTGRMPAADTLRDLKAEQMQLKLARQKGELLERELVIGGFVGRFERIIASCKHKAHEIATMAHGQTVDAIEKLIAHHHEDQQRQWSELQEFLELPADAEKKLVECLNILTTNEHE